MDQYNRRWTNEEFALYLGWKKTSAEGYIGHPDGHWKDPKGNGHEGVDFHLSYDMMLEIVELIEKQGFGVKMCRKVVEIYVDDTKENIIYSKKKDRKESLWDALQQFTWLAQTDQNIRDIIRIQEKKNIEDKAKSILKSWADQS